MQMKLSAQPQFNFMNQLKQQWFNLKEHFAVVPLKTQQSTTVLITRLEEAINSGQPIAIQMNQGFDQESIQDFYGIVFQDQAGSLIIEDEHSNQCQHLIPGLLRHIG